jgi:CHAT domain-containing protein
MRSTVASAYWDMGDYGRAEKEFAATLRPALVDDDVTVTDLVLQGLQLMYRRDPARLARVLDHFPAEAAAASARRAEARCRFARASAWDATPTETDVARSLGIADEFLRAARAFADLGETGWQAKAVYSASGPLNAVALLRPEYRAQVEEVIVEAERLFRDAGDWHGVGVAAFGLSELLNRDNRRAPRDSERIVAALERSIEAFCRAGRPQAEANALLVRAELAALHDDSADRFADQCLEAFAAYERGRADRMLPSEREVHDQSRDLMFLLLGPRIAAFVGERPDDPRGPELVWGMEQIVKARSMQDQLMARELWLRFLTRDDQLRRLNQELEQVRFALEQKQRDGENLQAGDLHEAIERLEQQLRHRLTDVAENVELDLASTRVPDWRAVQAVLRPGELYVGLVFCRDDLFLRCRLTADTARFDAVRAPEVMALLLQHLAVQKLSREQLVHAQERAYQLLGLTEPGIDTLLICPDRQLVAVPWHLLEPERQRKFLGDQLTIAIVPAAGALVSIRRAASGRPDGGTEPAYLGVSHDDGTLITVDQEVENIQASYFPRTGRCLLTGDGHRLVEETGHVGLLHVASHAYATGLAFGERTITPIMLAGMTLTADVLLLTGCFLGAFGRADRNEFVGIVRQLLITTGAGAAVVSAERVPQEAGNVLSDLVVSGLTGRAPGKQWAPPAEPLAVGPAVSWARLRMREMRRARKDLWWSPWFVVGDPSTRLRASR